MFISNTAHWAYDTFHQAKQGDVRRCIAGDLMADR
ncbi:Uncharacterised protein [Serratia liquefaciens]|nr:Uncharacterised protein [Serratia liquefaciens]